MLSIIMRRRNQQAGNSPVRAKNRLAAAIVNIPSLSETNRAATTDEPARKNAAARYKDPLVVTLKPPPNSAIELTITR